MFSTFSIALSALNGNSVALDAIGNNLANMNTTGFKGSAVSFHDLVSQALIGSNSQVGGGMTAPSIVGQFTQGSIQTTGGPLNAAIQGQGFFVVKGQTGQTLYTRAGNFQMDAAGDLLTSTGEKVQGWGATNGVVNASGAPANVLIAMGAIQPPTATTSMSMDLNLNAATAKDGTFSAPIEVVDALGATHTLTATFTNTGPGAWKYDISIPGEDLKAGTAGTPSAIAGASGTLTFDGSGKLTSPAVTAAATPIKVAGLADGATDMSINWSFFNADNSPRLTGFGQTSAISATAQDGAQAGQISGVSISDGGMIMANYSNGKQQIVGQLALASIQNPESLIAVGNNNLQASADTAAAALGAPGTGARGTIVGEALEGSNVDMAREFTNLIIMQRSYQANAKVITATDELSQVTVNMKS